MKRKIVLLLSISLMSISLLASCSKEEEKTPPVSTEQAVEEKSQEEAKEEKMSPDELADAFNNSMADATANFWDI